MTRPSTRPMAPTSNAAGVVPHWTMPAVPPAPSVLGPPSVPPEVIAPPVPPVAEPPVPPAGPPSFPPLEARTASVTTPLPSVLLRRLLRPFPPKASRRPLRNRGPPARGRAPCAIEASAWNLPSSQRDEWQERTRRLEPNRGRVLIGATRIASDELSPSSYATWASQSRLGWLYLDQFTGLHGELSREAGTLEGGPIDCEAALPAGENKGDHGHAGLKPGRDLRIGRDGARRKFRIAILTFARDPPMPWTK